MTTPPEPDSPSQTATRPRNFDDVLEIDPEDTPPPTEAFSAKAAREARRRRRIRALLIFLLVLIPVLAVLSWYDLTGPGTMHDYKRLVHRLVPVGGERAAVTAAIGSTSKFEVEESGDDTLLLSPVEEPRLPITPRILMWMRSIFSSGPPDFVAPSETFVVTLKDDKVTAVEDPKSLSSK